MGVEPYNDYSITKNVKVINNILFLVAVQVCAFVLDTQYWWKCTILPVFNPE